MMTTQELVDLQRQAEEVTCGTRPLIDYVVAVANATRGHELLQIGVSPRGSLGAGPGREGDGGGAAAATTSSPRTSPATSSPVFAHRCISKGYLHDADTTSTARVLQQIMQSVSSPV